jgi:hypothetical protein
MKNVLWGEIGIEEPTIIYQLINETIITRYRVDKSGYDQRSNLDNGTLIDDNNDDELLSTIRIYLLKKQWLDNLTDPSISQDEKLRIIYENELVADLNSNRVTPPDIGAGGLFPF